MNVPLGRRNSVFSLRWKRKQKKFSRIVAAENAKKKGNHKEHKGDTKITKVILARFARQIFFVSFVSLGVLCGSPFFFLHALRDSGRLSRGAEAGGHREAAAFAIGGGDAAAQS